jgi:hypothetical protein
MPDDTPQEELLQEMARLLKRFEKSGDMAPIEHRDMWDSSIAFLPPEERELVEELARFGDLWRYFRERKEKLGPEIVGGIRQLHQLAVPERIARLREINLKLMERTGNAGEGTQFRH